MTVATAGLGAYALAVDPALRRQRPAPRDLATGLTSAAGLYGVFRVGERLARRIMPAGGEELGAIYELGDLLPRWATAALIAVVIAPAEELFYRGLVQGGLARRLGPLPGTAAATLLYAAVHLATGNLTLVGAALVAGSWWGLQGAAQGRLPALIVSHVCLDLALLLGRGRWAVGGGP